MAKSAKKAVKKAQLRKEDMMLQAAMQAEMMQQAGPIDPEIQAQQIAMQPTVNPYGRMGTVPPNVYDYDNRLSGYVGVQPVFNPEV